MAPHESANIDGLEMNISDLVMPETENDLIIEMAGGLMVPINEKELFIDFIEEHQLEVVLVSSYYLGSINHTLLSIEALKRRNINLSGIIFNGEKVKSTFDIINTFASQNILLEINQENKFNSSIN